MENGLPILPNAYVNMAKELKYPVIEVHGKLTLNVAASLPRLLDAASSVQGAGESSASSQSGSDGGPAHGEIVLSGGGGILRPYSSSFNSRCSCNSSSLCLPSGTN